VKPHTSLQRVGILGERCISSDSATWARIGEHIASFGKEGFPALREYVFYGSDWLVFREDLRFEELEMKVKEMGRSIVFA